MAVVVIDINCLISRLLALGWGSRYKVVAYFTILSLIISLLQKLQTTSQCGSSQSGGRGSSSANSASQPLPVYQLRAVGLVAAEVRPRNICFCLT